MLNLFFFLDIDTLSVWFNQKIYDNIIFIYVLIYLTGMFICVLIYLTVKTNTNNLWLVLKHLIDRISRQTVDFLDFARD